jgi:hypothetical protein
MAPRRLSMHHGYSKDLFIQKKKLAANTCSKLYTRARANGRKREEWERFGHSNSRMRIDVK